MTSEEQQDDLVLTAAEQRVLDSVDGMLADASVWAMPPAGLQEQIVAAIAAENRPRRSRGRLYAVLGAAAALVIASSVVLGVALSRDHPVTFAGALAGTTLSPGASGEVKLTRSDSGWKVYLDAEGLPRRADGEYYEAWLKNAAGVLVPVGTFNSFHDVTLWAGVAPSDYPTFTVTRQEANGDPASTGEVVLIGSTARTH